VAPGGHAPPFDAFESGEVDRSGGARGERMVTLVLPLRSTVDVRWPRSVPRASMFAGGADLCL
jgi:hypothetical protein